MAGAALSPEMLTANRYRLLDCYGLECFTTNDARETLHKSRRLTNMILTSLVDQRFLKRVLHSTQIQAFLDRRAVAFDVFSFDFTTDPNVVLDQFDPIPIKNRSLKIQLVGDEAIRFREVVNYRDRRILPPRPTDRPFDQWEQEVFFGKYNPKPINYGDC